MRGGLGTGKPMSNRTLGMIRSRLKAVFSEAVNDQIIAVNPLDAVRKVRSGTDSSATGGIALDFEQVALFHELGATLYAAGLSRLWVALFTAVSLGLRRGEVMGLRWQDVDLERGMLMIKQNLTGTSKPVLNAPKTKNSIRDIPIPPSLNLMLQQHRKQQGLEQQEAGSAWQDLGAVFATEMGTYTHPANLDRALKGVLGWSQINGLERRMWGVPREYRARLEAIVKACTELPKISPHDLRHTAGTLMLRRKMPVEVVSKILGHARVSITLDVYRHVLGSELKAEMIDLFPYPVQSRESGYVSPLN
jgi:integrase